MQNWNLSMDLHRTGRFRESLIAFLEYIKRSDSNVGVDRLTPGTNFFFVQGSARINGCLEDGLIRANASLVREDSLNRDTLLYLLQKNDVLQYCRYAINENGELILLFDSFVQDANPYKLYYGFQELALLSDKMDDLIGDIGQTLSSEMTDMISPNDQFTKEVKTDYFRSFFNRMKNEIENGFNYKNTDDSLSIYQILGGFYSIDFLLLPQGSVQELMERAHKTYFSNRVKSAKEQKVGLKKSVDELISLSNDELNSEWYTVEYTFGVNPPIDIYVLRSKLRADIGKIDWYIEQGQDKEAALILDFHIGYLLYIYALPELIKSLFEVYFMISHHTLFQSLMNGFNLTDQQGHLKAKTIRKYIGEILEDHRSDSLADTIDKSKLNYESRARFGRALVEIILQS